MGFWPFGSSKKNRPTSSQDQTSTTLLEKSNSDQMAAQRRNKTGRRPPRSPEDEKPGKLSKSRTESYQSNNRSLPRSQKPPYEAVGTVESQKAPDSTRGITRRASNLYQQSPMSQSSIGPENFSTLPHPPTLYAKRPDFDPSVPRKKSSKRKADDYAREREIQAMSTPIPIPKPKRPATYSGSGPLARDTRNIPGDMNKQLSRPASQISLPRQEDIENYPPSTQNSFKIGVFSALSPRPSLKLEGPRVVSGKQSMRQISVEPAIEEEDLANSQKRIDALADGLSSSGIRELMERDRRRREKKKETDKVKLQRKLQRRAEKQREDETRRTRAEEFASQSSIQAEIEPLTQQDVDDGAPGPAVDDRAGLTTENERLDVGSAAKVEENPFADPRQKPIAPRKDIRNPFEDDNDVDVMRDPSIREDDDDGPPIPVKSPRRKAAAEEPVRTLKPSQGALSPPVSPVQDLADTQSFSQTSAIGRNTTPEVLESIERDRRSSDQSGQQLSSWTSFFRRGGRRKPSATERSRGTPSEFSNTSRESFARKPQPPPIVPPGRSFRRSDSATPQRTMSKFREDLPELPLSPPDSRMQSPEAPASSLSSKQVRQSLSGTLDAKSLATSSSNPTLDRWRPDSRLQTGRTGDTDMTTPEPAIGHNLSQSLASVDSEASWLSGRPAKRSSGILGSTTRHSGLSNTAQAPGASETQEEDDDIVQDEYLNQLTPAPEERQDSSSRKASSTIIDLQKERAQSPVPEVPPLPTSQDERWHAGAAKHPTLIQQPRAAKSREGLLNEFGGDDDEASDEAESPVVEEAVELMRAKSVDYKSHARHVSAGSARLLDIRRSSTISTDTPPRSPVPAKSTPMGEHKSASATKL